MAEERQIDGGGCLKRGNERTNERDGLDSSGRSYERTWIAFL
jgi:hypothetical protein